MKQGHVGLIFLVIWLACFSMLFVSKEKYRSVQEEKQRIEQALLEAIKYTGEEYSSVMNATLKKRQDTLEHAFFESLYASMGVFEHNEEQELLRMHVPMMMIAEEEGASFYYVDEKVTVEGKEFSFTWTERTDYSWEEHSTETKRQKVIELLETKASEIISKHNYIAEQYGISYSFFVPRFLQNTTEEIQFPMLFVVFQGWPLSVSNDIFYENCLDAGVFLQEVRQYTVTVSRTISDTYSYYHERDCNMLTHKDVVCISETVSKNEAIRTYGAFPCKNCNP